MKTPKKQIIILTGFLASGKTTLIRELLNAPNVPRIAVIMNEFSEQQNGIEKSLLIARTGERLGDFYELPNGCLCCSAQSDFLRAIRALLDAADRPAIDCFVVEANGLADVGSVGGLWADDAMEVGAELTSVVCVVDCSRFWQIKENYSVFDKQICIADLVVLNKSDLVSFGELKRIRESIETISEAEFVETSYARLPIETLFKRRFAARQIQFRENEIGDLRSAAVRSHYFAFENGERFDPNLLETAVGELLWETFGGRIYRLKGVFCATNGDLYEIQGYDSVFEVRKVGSADAITAKFLFIGSELGDKAIGAALKSAIK